MPVEIDQVQRRLMQLQIEEEALKKERDAASKARVGLVKHELADLESQANAMRARNGCGRREIIDEIPERAAASRGPSCRSGAGAAQRRAWGEGRGDSIRPDSSTREAG